MPAACGHKLALIIVSMGQWEKQRAFTVVVAIEVMIFRRKRNPETYPCLPFSLIAYIHHNDNSHCNDYNRPSGADTLIRATRKVSCPNIGFTIFLTAQTIFIRWIPHCIPCTLALSDFFLSLPLRHITPWHFWHFRIMKCARVQGVHGG